jgi:uncharacterized protein YjdB
VLTGRVVTWSSSDTTVAAVSSTGLYTGVAPGTAKISATSEGISGVSSVTVSPAITVFFEVPAPNAAFDDSILVWAVVNSSFSVASTVATVGAVQVPLTFRQSLDPANWVGVVHAPSAPYGPAQLVVTTTDTHGNVGTRSIALVHEMPVATVVVTPATGTVFATNQLQLTVSLFDVNGTVLKAPHGVTWSSSNTALATVNSSGMVTGVAGGGPVTITATSEGKSGTATLTVAGPANSP